MQTTQQRQRVIFPGDVTVEGTLRADTIESDQQALVFIKHETDNPRPPSNGLGFAYIALLLRSKVCNSGGTPLPEATTLDTNNEEARCKWLYAPAIKQRP